MENSPILLTTKLLFEKKPFIDPQAILEELQKYFENVELGKNEKGVCIFVFPDIEVELDGGMVKAQCTTLFTNETGAKSKISDEAFDQNWHWEQAKEAADACQYEILVTDFMTRTLDYKDRMDLYMNFLLSVITVTKPDVLYAFNCQKLIQAQEFIDIWTDEILYGLINVRLFNLGDDRLLMDTYGLYTLGLPDFEIEFSTDLDEGEIAGLLYNYAYYLYDNGDIIKEGNTLDGLEDGEQWECKRTISKVDNKREVIQVIPSIQPE